MRKWDRIASLVGLVGGGGLILGSLRLDLGSLNQPGPGFVPLGTAVLVVALSLTYAVRSFQRAPDGKESPWPKENPVRLIAAIGSLFLFGAALSSLGYVLSTFTLMTVLFLIAEPEKWLAALIKAVLSTAVTYLVFEKWLMVQFPSGFLGA